VTALTHSGRSNNDRVYVPKRSRVRRAGGPAGRAVERDGAGSRIRSSRLATVLAGLVLALLGFVPTADASVAAAVPINSYDQSGYIYDGTPHTYDRLDHFALAHAITTAAVTLAADAPAPPNPVSVRAVAANTTAKVLKGPIADAVPKNLPEQIALDTAKQGYGRQIMGPMGDAPRLVANYGEGEWVKMQYVLRGNTSNVTVHYFRNIDTGMDVEFKFP